VLPGGGGTQRLTALVGIKTALEMACAAKSLPAADALKLGIVDALVPPAELAAAALDFLKKKIESGEDYRRPWHKDDYRYGNSAEEKDPDSRKKLFEMIRQMTLKQTKGHVRAPMKIIDAVEEGAEKGFQAGSEKGTGRFCRGAVQPGGEEPGRFIPDAERMSKVYGSKDRSIKPAEIKKVGVLGAGLMGSGIAHSFILAGKKVVMKDVSDEALARGVKSIEGILMQGVKKGKMTEDKAKGIMALLQPTKSYEDFRDVDMVVEAVFEDMDLKHKTIREVEQYIPEHCIWLPTPRRWRYRNWRRPPRGRVDGRHALLLAGEQDAPPRDHQGKQTAEKTTVTAVAASHATKKLPIVVNDGYGFYTTRIVAAYLVEALNCLNDGADVKTIDEALVGYGMPVGPITLMDEVGHDVGEHVCKIMQGVFPTRFSDELTKVTVDNGRLGRKNGKGFSFTKAGKSWAWTNRYTPCSSPAGRRGSLKKRSSTGLSCTSSTRSRSAWARASLPSRSTPKSA